MRTICFSIILFLSFSSLGEKDMITSYSLEKEYIDQTLNDGEAVFEFHLNNLYYTEAGSIQYSIDGKTDTYVLDQERKIVIKSTPGKHSFQFFYNENYYEIYTNVIAIANKTHAIYALNFEASRVIEVSEKPVIYLYPEKEIDVEVTVDINGENPFMYPPYEGKWKFTATPSGELTFGTDTYNYLFWEAERVSKPSRSLEGFVVNKTSVVSFLEEKLTIAGLTSKEQADFITYWGPRLMAHDKCFVRFNFNEACNKYAKLLIKPTPDNIYRIYIEWYPLTQALNVTEQEILMINRDGFTVLEWGGVELPPVVKKLNVKYPTK